MYLYISYDHCLMLLYFWQLNLWEHDEESIYCRFLILCEYLILWPGCFCSDCENIKSWVHTCRVSHIIYLVSYSQKPKLDSALILDIFKINFLYLIDQSLSTCCIKLGFSICVLLTCKNYLKMNKWNMATQSIKIL